MVHQIAGIQIALQQKEEDEEADLTHHKTETSTKNETLELQPAEVDSADHENDQSTRSMSDEDLDSEMTDTREDIITMMMHHDLNEHHHHHLVILSTVTTAQLLSRRRGMYTAHLLQDVEAIVLLS